MAFAPDGETRIGYSKRSQRSHHGANLFLCSRLLSFELGQGSLEHGARISNHMRHRYSVVQGPRHKNWSLRSVLRGHPTGAVHSLTARGTCSLALSSSRHSPASVRRHRRNGSCRTISNPVAQTGPLAANGPSARMYRNTSDGIAGSTGRRRRPVLRRSQLTSRSPFLCTGLRVRVGGRSAWHTLPT